MTSRLAHIHPMTNQSNTSLINTDVDSRYHDIPVIFWSFLALETLVIVFANFMLCWLFMVNRKLRTQQNYFVLSLSVSDLLVGICVAPCEYCAIQKEQYQGLNCPLFCGSVISFNMLASVMNLVLIAMDRYCSIKMPFRYQEILSKKRAIIVICISWLFTFTITLTPLSWMLNFQLTFLKQLSINTTFTQVLFSFVFLLGFLLLIIYYTIVKTIREKLRSIKEHHTNTTGIKVCILVALSFFICWIPTAIVEILNQSGMILPYGVSNAAYFVMLINPCLDPILYAYYRTDFRNELSTWSGRQWKRIKTFFTRFLNKKSTNNNNNRKNSNFYSLKTLITQSTKTGTCNVVRDKSQTIVGHLDENSELIIDERVSVL